MRSTLYACAVLSFLSSLALVQSASCNVGENDDSDSLLQLDALERPGTAHLAAALDLDDPSAAHHHLAALSKSGGVLGDVAWFLKLGSGNASHIPASLAEARDEDEDENEQEQQEQQDDDLDMFFQPTGKKCPCSDRSDRKNVRIFNKVLVKQIGIPNCRDPVKEPRVCHKGFRKPALCNLGMQITDCSIDETKCIKCQTEWGFSYATGQCIAKNEEFKTRVCDPKCAAALKTKNISSPQAVSCATCADLDLEENGACMAKSAGISTPCMKCRTDSAHWFYNNCMNQICRALKEKDFAPTCATAFITRLFECTGETLSKKRCTKKSL